MDLTDYMEGRPPAKRLFGRHRTESTRVSEQSQEFLYGTLGQTWMSRLTRGKEGVSANPEKTAYETFSDMADDAGIAFPLNIIKWLAIRTPWDLICTDNEIKSFILKNLNNIWRPLIRACTHAFKYGWVGMEKRFKFNEKDGKWYYDRFIDLRPHGNQLRIIVTPDGSFNGLVQIGIDGKNVIIPKEKSFVYTYDKEFGNLYGRSMLRSAFRYWYSDRYFYDYQAIYAEQRAIEPLIMRAPAGKTKRGVDESGNDILVDNLDLAQEIGESIRNASVVTLPSAPTGNQGVEQWKADPLTSSGEKFPFNESHAHFDKMKARGMGVPDELSQGGSGSLAKAKEQGSFFLLQVEGILEDIADHAHQYIITPLLTLNFPKDRLENTDVFFKFTSLRDDDRQFALSVIDKTREKFSPAIDVKSLMEMAKIPINEEFLINQSKSLEELKKSIREGEEVAEEKPAFGGLGGLGGGLKPATAPKPAEEKPAESSMGGKLKEISAPLTIGGGETAPAAGTEETAASAAQPTLETSKIADKNIRMESVKQGDSNLNKILRAAEKDAELFWNEDSKTLKNYLGSLGANLDTVKRIKNETLLNYKKYVEVFKSYASEAFEAGARDACVEKSIDNFSITDKISSSAYSLLNKKAENFCSNFVKNSEDYLKDNVASCSKISLESSKFTKELSSRFKFVSSSLSGSICDLLNNCYKSGKDFVNK